jgi:hypothetical protein
MLHFVELDCNGNNEEDFGVKVVDFKSCSFSTKYLRENHSTNLPKKKSHPEIANLSTTRNKKKKYKFIYSSSNGKSLRKG